MVRLFHLSSSPLLTGQQDDEALLGRPVLKNFGEILLRILHGVSGPFQPDVSELPNSLDHSDKQYERTVKSLHRVR